ncbi:Pex11 domain protein (AoPex11B), partial [Colletotrichum musicola]
MTSFEFDQLVAFGSDSAGLERILRALQSLVVILLTHPSLLSILSIPQAPGIAALLPLKSNLNLSRRAIRLFWFLNSFGTSYNLYTSSSSSSRSAIPLETWLDIVRLTLLGLYAGIESATLLDLLGLPNVSVFGEEQT